MGRDIRDSVSQSKYWGTCPSYPTEIDTLASDLEPKVIYISTDHPQKYLGVSLKMISVLQDGVHA